jgi:hypothetical protein
VAASLSSLTWLTNKNSSGIVTPRLLRKR